MVSLGSMICVIHRFNIPNPLILSIFFSTISFLQ